MTNILKNFWVFEGLDGAGTTTQLKNIKSKLEELKRPAFITCEPTVNPTGVFLRRILSGEVKVQQSVIAHMFATDRDDHLFNPEYGILEHLSRGETVVSDRYFFSSLAYQSIGFNYCRVKELNADFPYPEVVIFIDTPPEDCIKRIDSRGNAKEIYEKLDYQKKVKENYEKCFTELPDGCTLLRIDGTLSREEIFSVIEQKLFN